MRTYFVSTIGLPSLQGPQLVKFAKTGVRAKTVATMFPDNPYGVRVEIATCEAAPGREILFEFRLIGNSVTAAGSLHPYIAVAYCRMYKAQTLGLFKKETLGRKPCTRLQIGSER